MVLIRRKLARNSYKCEDFFLDKRRAKKALMDIQ